MNSLIYTEESRLIIEKPNGLRYEFENVDKPELGFEFDVVVYDDIEVKVLKWEDDKGNFDEQTHTNLTNDEKDSIETYIANSEPPIGYNLNNQYLQQMNELCKEYVVSCAEKHGFDSHIEASYVGREGSAHPYRSNARRVLEYTDAIWCCYVQIADEISTTREDLLKSYDKYCEVIPQPQIATDGQNNG
jgi:hypothetical protein|tara:strand:- start:877 stop:1443 length:567 start_codon:yes stop_codon:yes gene_type:complete